MRINYDVESRFYKSAIKLSNLKSILLIGINFNFEEIYSSNKNSYIGR